MQGRTKRCGRPWEDHVHPDPPGDAELKILGWIEPATEAPSEPHQDGHRVSDHLLRLIPATEHVGNRVACNCGRETTPGSSASEALANHYREVGADDSQLRAQEDREAAEIAVEENSVQFVLTPLVVKEPRRKSPEPRIKIFRRKKEQTPVAERVRDPLKEAVMVSTNRQLTTALINVIAYAEEMSCGLNTTTRKAVRQAVSEGLDAGDREWLTLRNGPRVTVNDILGIAPDWTGDLSTEEYMDQIRGRG